mmetsp:Transcript_12428/g.24662  ORF Transcript_12428/g.24662 Transcript_12428/m.24662 type:complete len:207 (+) Transcript_12428:67-687(+)
MCPRFPTTIICLGFILLLQVQVRVVAPPQAGVKLPYSHKARGQVTTLLISPKIPEGKIFVVAVLSLVIARARDYGECLRRVVASVRPLELDAVHPAAVLCPRTRVDTRGLRVEFDAVHWLRSAAGRRARGGPIAIISLALFLLLFFVFQAQPNLRRRCSLRDLYSLLLHFPRHSPFVQRSDLLPPRGLAVNTKDGVVSPHRLLQSD